MSEQATGAVPAAVPAAVAVAVPARRAVSPWIVLAAVFLASVVAVMAQFAAPPLLPALMDSFRVGIGEASSLVSIFSVTGLILALPAGLVLARFGPVATGGVALVAVAVGSVVGATASSFGLLLATRAVQGVGVGLIGVVAPAVVAASFPPERRGMPMGIWSMWVPVGGVLMYVLAPVIGTRAGWMAVWWIVAVAALAALVAWVVVLRAAGLGRPGGGPGGPATVASAAAELRRGLAGREIWLLALVFLGMSTANAAMNTLLPTFLVDKRAFALGDASLLSGVVLVGAGTGAFFAGMISDRVGSRRLVLIVAAILAGFTVLAWFHVPNDVLVPFLFVAGAMSGAIPSVIFAAVPEAVVEPRLAGAGMAAIMLGQNAGFVAGPAVFAALLPGMGWGTVGVVFAVGCWLAALLAWRAKVR